jgi:acyl-CoA thioesterase I
MKGILCFGDSITFGRGEQPCLGWVGRLKQYFESKDFYNCVYNLGIPGETSTQLLQRFDTECKPRANHRRHSKYVLIIAIGMNDCRLLSGKPAITPETFTKNIHKLINKAKSYKEDLVLLSLTTIDEKRTQPFDDKSSFLQSRVDLYNQIIARACHKYQVSFLTLPKLTPKLIVDGVHPNSQGYDLIYKAIKKHLIKNKLIK